MPYGKAFGYATDNGEYSTHFEYDNRWRQQRLIPVAGTYRWSLVEGADVASYRKGVAAGEAADGLFHIGARLFFGKYKEKDVLEIFKTDPGYIDWALRNIKPFVLTGAAFLYLSEYRSDFRFSEEAMQAQSVKLLYKQQ